MTLDDNIVLFNDFTLTNLTPPYGGLMDVYTYTFDDENEHTLKIWTKSTDTFRFGVWSGGPSGYNYGFSSIKDIVIPNSVTTIGKGAFCYCTNLTHITIPNSVTSIGSCAFYVCESLTSITIPNGVTSIDDAAFSKCTNLTSITIPNGVTSIGERVFYNCSNLRSITIPNSVTSIGEEAFQSCSSLTNITIPDSVTSIGPGAFNRCSSLVSVTVESTTPPTLESRYGDYGHFDNNASGRKIYVQSASVNTYKTATNWSTYANDI